MKRLIKSTILVGGLLLLLLMLASQAQADRYLPYGTDGYYVHILAPSPTWQYLDNTRFGGRIRLESFNVSGYGITGTQVQIRRSYLPWTGTEDTTPLGYDPPSTSGNHNDRTWDGTRWGAIVGTGRGNWLNAGREGSTSYYNLVTNPTFVDGVRYDIKTRVYIHYDSPPESTHYIDGDSSFFTFDGTNPAISYTTVGSYVKIPPVIDGTASDVTTGIESVKAVIFTYIGTSLNWWNGTAWVSSLSNVPAVINPGEERIPGGTAHWRFTFPTLTNGKTYYYGLFSEDRAGNVFDGPAGSFAYDNVIPTITLTTPNSRSDNYCSFTLSPLNVKYNSSTWNKRIIGTASDASPGSGTDRVEVFIQRSRDNYYFNGSTSTWVRDAVYATRITGSGMFSYTYTPPDAFFTTLGVGATDIINVKPVAYDRAGNPSIDITHNFKIDNIKPTSTITTPLYFSEYPDTIDGTASDNYETDYVKLTIRRDRAGDSPKYLYYHFVPPPGHSYLDWTTDSTRFVDATLSGSGPSRTWSLETDNMFDDSADHPEDQFVISAKAVDAAGNEQSPTTSRTITSDSSEPFLSIGLNSYTNYQFERININAWDDRFAISSVRVQIKCGSQYWNSTGRWDGDSSTYLPATFLSGTTYHYVFNRDAFWVGVPNGSRLEITARSVNAAGTETIRTQNTTYDITPPTNAAITYDGVLWQNTDPAWIYEGSRGYSHGEDSVSGLARYDYDVNYGGGTVSTGTFHRHTPAFTFSFDRGEGIYNLNVTAVDSAGNRALSPVTFPVGYDCTPPAAFTIDLADTIDTLTPAVNWTAAVDAVSGVDHYDIQLDGRALGRTTTATTFNIDSEVGLTNGTHLIEVIAYDKAWNSTTATKNINVRTHQAPRLEISSPLSGAWTISPSVNVIGSASDDSRIVKIEYSLNGGAYTTIFAGSTTSYDFTEAVALTPGTTNVVIIRAFDDTDMSSTATVTILNDQDPPTVPNPIYPVNNGWATDHPTFCWEPSTDSLSGVAGYDLYLDSVKANTELITDAAYSVTGLPVSDHTYSVTAYDNAGNSAVSSTISFKVDNVAPNAFTITAPSYAAAAFDVSWTESADADSGLAAYDVYINGSKVTEVAAPATSARITNIPADGNHTIYVLARDVAGNTTQSNTVNIVTNPNCPDIILKVDGRITVNGDRIRSVPAINAEIRDNSGIDSGKVKIYIDEQLQENLTLHATETQAESITAYEAKQENVKLNAGKHTIKVTAQDIYGKETIVERIDLDVLGKAVVDGRVMNYPNPFKPVSGQPTSINYNLLDDADVMIRIYNMSGRLVWEKTCYARAIGGSYGGNDVTFDGKSPFGDYLANGAYVGILTDLKGKVLATFELAVYE